MKFLKTLLIVVLVAAAGFLSAENYKYNVNQLALNAMQSYTNAAGTSLTAISLTEEHSTNWILVDAIPDLNLDDLFTTSNMVSSVTESNYFSSWEYYTEMELQSNAYGGVTTVVTVVSAQYWTNLSYWGNLTNFNEVKMLNTIIW